jgi:nucleotide-binding universal stress UspA family protein
MVRILVAVEAAPDSDAVVEAAASLALGLGAEVTVLSVRERERSRGVVWDRREPAEVVEAVDRALYTLRRRAIPARGMVRIAPAGRVASEILSEARRQGAGQIMIGSSRRSWLLRLIFGSVSLAVLRGSEVPVTAVPTWRRPTVSGRAQPAPPRTPPETRTPRPR